MNIFVLSEDTVECAQMHCDIHVNKMAVESAQMLCTAIYRFSRGTLVPPYKPTHKRHPCVLWAQESIQNFMWLADLGLQLCAEYEHRFNKKLKVQSGGAKKVLRKWRPELGPSREVLQRIGDLEKLFSTHEIVTYSPETEEFTSWVALPNYKELTQELEQLKASYPIELAEVFRWCLDNCPRFPHVPMTARPQVVTQPYVTDDTVEAYRNYYCSKASNMKMRYTKRNKPEWLI